MVRHKQLKNVIFKEFMPQEEYLQFLSSCDVGMIILHEKMATPNFPSKSLSYLNMKVPILAALDHTTDFGEYLESHNAGLWAYSDDIAALKKKLLMYYDSIELRNQVKENGYQLFMNNLTPQHAYKTIISDFIDE
jgi:glycosyltransferase involved in cell wall biosynthesis